MSSTPDVTKVEEIGKKFIVRFILVFISAILSFWIGLGNVTVTGLWGALDSQWDTAGGIALIAAIGAAGGGFLLGQAQSVKAKRLAARL